MSTTKKPGKPKLKAKRAAKVGKRAGKTVKPATPLGRPQRSPAQTREEVAKMLGRYEKRIQREAKVARLWMRKRLPAAYELVYDNYNALVFGYSPNDRSSSAFISLALYPQYVTLFFLPGNTLRDPKHLLRGEGTVVRHIPLKEGVSLTDPAVRALVDQAVANAGPMARPQKGVTVIKSISAKQRPRRTFGA